MGYLCVFAVILLYKLLSNFSRMIMTKFYQSKYKRYISSRNFDFTVYTYSIKKLFDHAGVAEGSVPYTQPTGYRHLVSGHAHLFDNMGVINVDVIAMMNSCFSKAYGTYRSRIFECLSPLYWIECIIFLPQKILTYLGVKADGLLVKLIQIFYWIITPLTLAFRADIYSYITELISKT